MRDEPIRWYHRVLLLHPHRVQDQAARLAAMGLIDEEPTLWQASMGVLYMLHRIAFRTETIGLAPEDPVRSTRRARALAWRGVRLPFLLWHRAVLPFDLTGLASSPQAKHAHLLGAFHPGENALYDLECIAWDRETLLRLRADLDEILAGRTRRARMLADLVVYEGYHERLSALVDRALAGDFVPAGQRVTSDTTLRAFVRWCTSHPATPRETLAAWRRGEVSFRPLVLEHGPS